MTGPEGTRRPSLLRSGGVGVAVQVAAGAALYLYAATLARGSGVADMGAVLWSTTLLSLGSLVCRLGFDASIVYFVPKHRHDGRPDAALGLVATSLAATALIASLMAFSFRAAIPPGVSLPLDAARAMAWALPLQALVQQIGSVGQAHGLVSWTFFQRAAVPSLALALTAGSWLTAGSFTALTAARWYLVAATACVLIAGAMLLPLLRRGYPLTLPQGPLGVLRGTLSYSLRVWPNGVLNYGFANLGIVALGILSTAAETGVFSAAAKTSVFVSYVLLGAGAAFAPHASRLHHARDLDRLEADYHRTVRWILLATFPIAGAFLLDGSTLLRLFGSTFDAGFVPLVVLTLAQLVNAATGPIGHLLTMTGRPQAVLATNLAVFAAALALYALLVPRYGALGAAVASGSVIAARNLLLLAWSVRRVGVGPPGDLPRYLGTFAVLAALALLVPGLPGLRTLVFWAALAGVAAAWLLPEAERAWLTTRLRRGRGRGDA